MARLPVVGSDDDQWGTILNQFLGVSLNADGTLNPGSLPTAASNAQGIVQLTNDLGGSATAPTVVSTHLTNPLPTSQGGTGNNAGKALIDIATAGTVVGTRSKLNFVGGSNVTITAADDSANGKVDVTINSSGGGGSGGLSDPTTTKGDLLVRSSSAVTRQPVGSNGQLLTADSTQTTGISWTTPGFVPLSLVTAKGDLIVATGSGAVARLAADTSSTVKYLKDDGSGNLSWAPVSSGGGGTAYTAKHITFASTTSGSYTASNYDFLLADASSSGYTVLLPTAANGATVRVKKVDSTTNAILVEGQSGSTIDGQASFVLNQNNYEPSQDFMSDGTNWFLV